MFLVFLTLLVKLTSGSGNLFESILYEALNFNECVQNTQLLLRISLKLQTNFFPFLFWKLFTVKTHSTYLIWSLLI